MATIEQELNSFAEFAKKRISNSVPLPPGMLRLAEVLAEIANNETAALTGESVCANPDRVEEDG